MQVITLTPSLLSSASRQLAKRVINTGFHPQVVIGVLTGGAEVARLMLPDLPAEALYCEVRVSRPSTTRKQQSFSHRLLRCLPIGICNVLRIVESCITEFCKSHSSLTRIGVISLPEQVESRLALPCQVLIVDDAIDSGATIQMVRQQLLSRFPHLDLRVSVITVTTPAPLCDAEYSLYHNRTLCRFPWSNDYRIQS